MAKEVTVLSIEGSFLRGVRLEERNGAFECADVESWPLAEEAPETAAEASGAHEEGVLAAPPSDEHMQRLKALVESFGLTAQIGG